MLYLKITGCYCATVKCAVNVPLGTDFIAIRGLDSPTLFLWPWTKQKSLATSWIWSCNANLGEELCCWSEHISNTHLPIIESEYCNSPHLWVLHDSCSIQWQKLLVQGGAADHTSPAPEMVLFPSLFIQDYPLHSPSPSFANCNTVRRPDERPFQ